TQNGPPPGVHAFPTRRSSDLGISGFREGPVEMTMAFPNADLVVHLSRPPEGEWVRLEAASEWRTEGYGLTRSHLADRDGPIGTRSESTRLNSSHRTSSYAVFC